MTIGPVGAKLAVVSRSPGKYDVQNGKPFTGPSGKVLDHLLEQNGVERKDVLVTNVVLCQTDKPPKEAIDACRLRLETEVNAAETIIACGPEAAKVLVNAKSVHAARGFVHNRENFAGRRQRVVVTSNPALVLRQSEAFPDLVRDFRRALNPPPSPILPEVRWTNGIYEAERWIRRLDQEVSPSTLLAADIESRGLAFNAPLVCVGLSRDGTKSIVFGESVVSDQNIRKGLDRFFRKEGLRYVWHNGKFDTKILRSNGIRAQVDDDTLLISYVLDERPGTHGLEYLLMEHLGWGNYEPASVKKFKQQIMSAEKNGRDVYAVEYDPDELYTYNGWDAAGTAQLYELLRKEMDDSDSKLYRNHLLPLNSSLTEVELTGFAYDIDAAAELLEMEVRPALSTLQKTLQKHVGSESYNPASPVQTSRLVYDEWKVKLWNDSIRTRPNKERSVDQPVYNELAHGRFVVGRDNKLFDYVVSFASMFAAWKQLDKQRSTYIEALIPLAERNNGRIYTSFKLHGTSSGRLSGEKPNLQNITRTKPGVPDIRSLFRASPEHSILQADYSQAELRVIAVLSEDQKLLDIYRRGDDLHSIVAERFYGVNFTKEQRANCKNMDFGVAYGQSAETFQEKHDIPKEEASEFIKWWWTEFTGVREWSKRVQRITLRDNLHVTPFGRKKRIHLITRENRSEVLRESVNFYPQSIAADLTLYSLISLVHEFHPPLGMVVNTVHDSIVLDIATDHLSDASERVRQIMESAPVESIGWDQIPFEVEILTGASWGEVS